MTNKSNRFDAHEIDDLKVSSSQEIKNNHSGMTHPVQSEDVKWGCHKLHDKSFAIGRAEVVKNWVTIARFADFGRYLS